MASGDPVVYQPGSDLKVGFSPGPVPPPGYGQTLPQAAGVAGGDWMAVPSGGQGQVYSGLEYLTMIDQLLVHQKIEILEALLGCETQNKYDVKNNMGQKVFRAIEDTDCLTRQCCGSIRPFDMKIQDNNEREIIHLVRPLNCQGCCCPCCLQVLEVYSSGNLIGYVREEWDLCLPKFRVENAAGHCVLRIEGPFCTLSICGDVEFQVLSVDGAVNVGKITKQWSGLIRETFSDADHFGVSFPMDLEVNMKAVLLGALFLIDFMYFEKTGGN